MPCDECSAAMESPARRVYCPTCIWCGARYIQQLGEVRVTREARAQWRKDVLDRWERHGHSREDMRAMAQKTETPYEPPPDVRRKSLSRKQARTGREA